MQMLSREIDGNQFQWLKLRTPFCGFDSVTVFLIQASYVGIIELE